MSDNVPHVYSLTKLTGRHRNDERRWVVFTVEAPRHNIIVFGVSLITSLAPTAVLIPFLGSWAFLAPIGLVPLGMWLLVARQKRGMKLRNMQAIVDKKRSKTGVLYASGEVMGDPVLVMHQQVVIPTPPQATADAHGPRSVRATPRSSIRARRGHASMRDLLED